MALRMAQPWSHPKTGILWFRRVVPVDLRDAVGKREERRSLQTRDPEVARVRFAKVSAEIEQRWANLRAGARDITEREANELAAWVYDDWFNTHAEDPSYQLTWQPDFFDDLWVADLGEGAVYGQETNSGSGVYLRSMRLRCRQYVDRCISHNGLTLSEFGHFKLLQAVAGALQRASVDLRALSAEAPLPVRQPASEAEWPRVPPRAEPKGRPVSGHQTGASVERTPPEKKAVTLTEVLKAW